MVFGVLLVIFGFLFFDFSMKGYVFLTIFLLWYLLPCKGQRYAPLPEWYNDYDVKFYKLDIEADDKTTDVKGYAEIVAEISTQELERFTLELAESVQVDSVRMNGRKTFFCRDGDLLYVIPPEPLLLGSKCCVTVYYAAFDINDKGFFTAVSNRRALRSPSGHLRIASPFD